MKKTRFRRALALLLACMMALSLLPASALAAGAAPIFADDPVIADGPTAALPAGEDAAAEQPARPFDAADLAAIGPQTYYVSLSGKGGNSGLSEADALPGLDAVPWSQLMPGDSVLLRKGDTFPGSIRMVGVHGTAEAPVTIGAYGTGNAPVIETRGQGIWLQETGSTATLGKYASSGVLLYDCSYVKVEGLDVVNLPDPMKATLETTISGKSNCDTIAYSGVAVAADGSAAAEGIELKNITVHGDASVQAVITETSSTVAQTAVSVGAAATARTLKNASETYYVSSLSGSDGNDGSTPDKAFYSLHKINELNLQPGAKIYLEYGSVFENQYLHFNGGGSSTAPVIVDAYGNAGNGRPLINTNGNGVWYQNFGINLDNSNHVRYGYVSSCIHLYDVPYIEIKNLAMTDGGTYGQTVNDFEYIGDGQVDGGTVPGETGYASGGPVGSYGWGGKMCRTGVSGVAQNMGTVHHIYLQNLDIENIYGNVFIKHMNNGGVYFTVAMPTNQSSTGIAKFDDVRVEGCYLKRTSRWGILIAYTAYHTQFNGAQIADAKCQQYGQTNLYVGHNYLEDVGGDPITLEYAFKPLAEYNVAVRGAREISGSVYHNGTAPNGNKGTVAAGIWPWKCKTALFEHNECYDMLNNDDGNGDGQPWDADYGDSTIYQYNYSSGNTGGCVMFCAGEAYNSVFRYNISFDDGSFARPAGIIDMAGNAYGQIHNNTFVMKEGLRLHYRTSGPAQIENNIFYNLGEPFDPQWRQNTRVVFNNNLYAGFTTKPDHDSKAIEMTKAETLFAGDVSTAPRGPKSGSKAGTGVTADGIRDWTHNWKNDFAMFKLAGGATKAINKGVAHSFTGLNQDASFGVAQVPIETDFYGNVLDEVHDIGAFDSRTADPADPGPSSSECELVSSLFEIRGTNNTWFQVPYTALNPTTVDEFKAGLTVSDGASVKVYNGTTEVTDGNVLENMTVKIVAQDGTTVNPTVYTIKQKNSYNSYEDWIGQQQGNAWFYQYWDGSKFVNHTAWDSQWSCWGGASPAYQSVERNQACGSIAAEGGSGFTFRAPVGGKVTVKYYNYKTAASPVENQVQKRQAANSTNTLTHSVRVFLNGVAQSDKTVAVNREATAVTTTEMTFTVDQGDKLSFVAYNSGDFTNNGGNNGIFFNPVLVYANEAYTPSADTTAPTVPGALAVGKVTQTGATLTWTASTDNRGVTGYKVKVGSAAEETVTGLTKVLTGLTPGTQYTVTVKAVDAAGNESAAATVTFATLAAPVVDTDPPAAPLSGSVKGAPTATTATLQWTASTSTDVAYYEIACNGVTETVRNLTQVTLTGLTAATAYTAKVTAVDAAGNKSAALSIPFTTGAADSQAPTAPAEAEIIRLTGNQATLRWSASTDNVGVAGYEVKLGDGAAIDAGRTLQHIFTGLEPAHHYQVSVRAYDAAGNYSAWKTVEFTTAASDACEILSTLFEVRGENNDQLQVPYTASNPMTAANLAAAFQVSPGASVKVFAADGATPVTGNVTAGMKVKVVAQDGVTANSTVYTVAQKNAYAHKADFVASQQGNVWFHQARNMEDQLVNLTSFDGGAQGWWTGGNNVCAEYNGAADDDRNVTNGSPQPQKFAGCGFVFRAPASGLVEVSFVEQPSFRYPAKAANNSFDTFVIVYVNGVMAEGKKTQVPESGSATIEDFQLTVQQGDTVEFMVVNEGAFTSNHDPNSGDVLFNPSVTYLDETFVPGPTEITLDKSEVTLYTNATETAQLKRTAQLTATVKPDDADQGVTWTSGNEAVATVSSTGLVTAVGNGDTYIRATATGSVGGTVTTTCQVHVRTRMETITVKKGGAAIGSDPIKLYTNEGEASLAHTVTLTADTTPANVSHPALNWTRPDGAAGRLTITRNNDGSATLTATTNELSVGAVTVQVASAEHPDVNASFTVHVVRMLKNPVSISGTPKFGQTLSVDLNQLSMSVFGKNALTYQWKRDGEAITGADKQSYTLVEDDIGTTISVDVTPNPATFYEGVRTASITGKVALADNTAVPTGLTAVDCTSGNDGQITGLDGTKAYQYKLDSATEWTNVTAAATSIENLPAGNYQVRFAATDTHAAGTNFATVTILAAGVNGHAITATATPAAGGVITVASKAAKETEVALTVTPNPGYTLKAGFPKVTYTDGEGAEQTVAVTAGKFTMPDAPVTVTAEFEAVKLTLTHALEHISCDQVEHNHEVAYGDRPTIHLTADEGYTMPSNITVVNAAGEHFTGYRYSHTVASPDEATITFTQPITEALTIRGAGDIKTYVVNYTLTGGLTAPEENAPRQVNYRALYEGTLVPNQGYSLPETIVVTVGGSLIGTSNFHYNKETGLVRIIAGQINGNVVITASGVKSGESVVSVTGVDLNLHRTNLTVGGSVALVPTITPENATNQAVVWATSDETIATVDENGVVTAVAEGTATITAMTVDGRHTAACQVTVSKQSSSGGGGGGGAAAPAETTKTVTQPDGSKVTTVTKPDGAKTITVTTKDGQAVAKVELPAAIPAPADKFVDLDATPWAETAVNNVAGLKLVEGIGGNKYDPVTPMTRGSLATVLHRLSSKPAGTKVTFNDVADGQYYTQGVAWAAQVGVVTGISADIFAPDQIITREQLATMLARYAKLIGLNTKADAKALEKFADGEKTGPWAVDSVAWCVEQGILKGKGNDTLDPTANVSRAEVAVMLDRFIALIQK